jgi:hypothetical protein
MLKPEIMLVRAGVVALLVSLDGGEAGAQSSAAGDPTVTYAAQGWSDDHRNTFYTTGQGSHMMPYRWFKALRRLDVDEAFGADQLQRYGYLRNDSPSNVAGLPVGFVIEGTAVSGDLGMTCAACHTGQLEYQKDGATHAMRLDGAPANADFQQFLTDLTEASRKTLMESDRFDSFANAVLGASHTAAQKEDLKTDYGDWVKTFGDFMDRSLPPKPAWGPGRLDAFGMIFNRVAGLDLGIHGNIKPADAPVSYPFLWNASRQDHTQWNGAVPNGLYIQGLARNTGEVFGVFATFNPTVRFPETIATSARINFQDNSANFSGLQTLEETIVKLQPPRWPFELKGESVIEQGRGLFVQHCNQCHEKKASLRLPHAWATPVMAVGTDPKAATNARRMGDPGLFKGARLPPPSLRRFKNPAMISDILAKSVLGSVRDSALTPPSEWEKSGIWRAIRKDLENLLPGRDIEDLVDPILLKRLWDEVDTRLNDMYAPASADAPAAYESRVLDGIWATAPYLHNGSVPNLWELLKPAKDRVQDFKVGSRVFDPENVGYMIDQSPFENGAFKVDPANANGNGNLGHEYGVELSEDDRWALVEYLKTL